MPRVVHLVDLVVGSCLSPTWFKDCMNTFKLNATSCLTLYDPNLFFTVCQSLDFLQYYAVICIIHKKCM
ncbi:hypothetical protein HanIR_Chr01g0003771 [Helianthus annuus]|nr:hypothetical protein HanIR_Chr01g0003771 [Helianthus annuus]